MSDMVDLDAVAHALPQQGGGPRVWLALTGGTAGVHLALMNEPYMTRVIDGSKTIESRWSKNRAAPWEDASVGDVILFSRTVGASSKTRPTGIVAAGLVSHIRFLTQRDPDDLRKIRQSYGPHLGIEEPFWEHVADRPYVSLLWLTCVVELAYGADGPQRPVKTDQRGWVPLRTRP